MPSGLSIIIVAYNRAEALITTLRQVATLDEVTALALPATAPVEIIVVDNASSDDTAARVRTEHPGVRLITMPGNTGVEAFNAGVRASTQPLVLILDDDARPDPAGLTAALDVLAREPHTGAVALLPVHPATRVPEWPFATSPARAWPFMGCGNLVRREAWDAAGGYDAAFFLYRNDCDLAMKLLAAGWDVAFDPTWIVWHDSPAAARKSERWLELATRNWCWLCRRHGRGLVPVRAIALGAARAAMLAGLSPWRVWKVIRGLAQGLTKPVPAAPDAVRPDGSHLRRMLQIRGV